MLAYFFLVDKSHLDSVLSPKDELCGPDPSLSEELTSILNDLTQLSKSEHCKVALRARQVGSGWGSWGTTLPPMLVPRCAHPLSFRPMSNQMGFSPVRLIYPSPSAPSPVGLDCLPPPLLRAEAQPGGVHFPVCHRLVWPPVLPGKPQGETVSIPLSQNTYCGQVGPQAKWAPLALGWRAQSQIPVV